MSRAIREPGRQLSPWDQAPYFQKIKETFFGNIGAGIQVALADPTRVGIIFSNPASGDAYVSTLPTVNVNRGIVIGVSQTVTMLTHNNFGPLVQQAWYAALNGASPGLTVIEILMSKWPGE